MELMEKLRILSDSAKYDASCSSSGSERTVNYGGIGAPTGSGCCHAFSADGRCISLLKVLFTNYCINDCKYCHNRVSNDIPRASFTPEELARLCIDFYRRNYIEGLFLSSGVIKSPDYTAELLLKTLKLLRFGHGFNGYIHVKGIPGASEHLLREIGFLADRMSVNIELPSERGLKLLAPQKTKESVLSPMKFIRNTITETKDASLTTKNKLHFVPAGQSTQMIIGATEDSDHHILNLTEALYKKYDLKRVYFSAYIPVGNHPALPKDIPPPLLREHRLYQADWLMRFYGFRSDEILSQGESFDPLLDPKCNWAMKNIHLFSVEINTAPYEMLLRVPGIGVVCAKRIARARKVTALDFEDLKKLRVVLKRAAYFITCKGKYMYNTLKMNEDFIYDSLVHSSPMLPSVRKLQQLSFFDGNYDSISPPTEERLSVVSGQL
ncbi:MAG: putative DNA modification/repair radical SAM protein [Clostridia bacterium]|nr:putative DNA modification/repair radical SAM protein [Clostridia bacterium]